MGPFGRRKGAAGYVVSTGPEGTVERDTLRCCHCQRHIIVPPGPPKPGEELYGVCRQCHSITCPPCAALGTCTPWEKQLERQEARGRMLKAILG